VDLGLMDEGVLDEGGPTEEDATVKRDAEQCVPDIEVSSPVTSLVTVHDGGEVTRFKCGLIGSVGGSSFGLVARSGVFTMENRTVEQRRRERIAALIRFRQKKAKRSFKKTVRYECRKKLADSRPRVKGRFVKKAEIRLYEKYGNDYRAHLDELKQGESSAISSDLEE